MNWINLRTETLRSPEFANAKPGAIETWLKVMAYCCEQENGGCILDGCSWNDRAWLMCCGVTKAEIEAANPLVYDDGAAVFVTAFPDEKQAEVQAKRKAGKHGGKASGKARREAQLQPVLQPVLEADNEAQLQPVLEAHGEADLERKGKEGEIEGKDKGIRNRNGKGNSRGTIEEVCAFAVELGLPPSDGEACFYKWEGNGWKNGSSPIRDWRATIRSWKAAGYLPSQKVNGSTPAAESLHQKESRFGF
jgi:hypothetical protein